MNADAFRHVYQYHFQANRAIWDAHITALSQAQFTQPHPYSSGSICQQVTHLLFVDQIWFSDLRRVPMPAADVRTLTDREKIRAYWDQVEAEMWAYLETVQDAMLLQKPIAEGEDKDLYLWQILLQVINHGTDHRAQILRLLNDLGQQTGPQDYVFFAYENPL